MRGRKFDWSIGGFLIGYQVLLFIALPFYFLNSSPSGFLIGISSALLFLIGTSVTGGYHRYFSHRTYKTNPFIECVLLFTGAMAIQSSAYRWANDHRLHHAHVDTDEDPYSINKGFWYAHFIWMLGKPDPIDPKIVSDLQKNPRVMFQHRFIVPLMFGSNALLWLFLGWLTNDYLGAFFIGVCLRVFVLHHLTWFINSLAHTWGTKPFCQEQTAVNNFILSILTFGEGYHNYHHVFAKDYRNGIRWYHFDPTKWLIWSLHKLGLVKDLRKMDEMSIRKRMIMERKSLLLERLENFIHAEKTHLENKILEVSERMINTISSCKDLRDKLYDLKKDSQKESMASKIKAEMDSLLSNLKDDWKQWRELSKIVLRSKNLSIS